MAVLCRLEKPPCGLALVDWNSCALSIKTTDDELGLHMAELGRSGWALTKFCGLSNPPAGLAQEPSALATKSRIEAMGYGDVKDLSRDRTGG